MTLLPALSSTGHKNCHRAPWIGLILLLGLLSFSGQAVVTAMASDSPDCVKNYDPDIDYFPQKATLSHAKGFTLDYFKHYKRLTVVSPWPNARQHFQYLLVLCGTPIPEGFTEAQIIRIPIRSIAILSSTHLPHLEILGANDRLVAVSAYKSVYSPDIRQQIDQGKISEVGRGANINIELILDLAPDLVTAVGHDQPQYNSHPTLQQAGVNVAINAEYVEPTLLGRSEWLKFTAAFLNQDGRAQQLFARMVSRYQAIAAQVRDLPAAQKPTVFGGFLHRDVWYAAGGDSYIAHLVADAGGKYLWADDTHRASIPLSYEVVYERAANADVWFTSGLDWFRRDDLLAANSRYGDFKAFRTGRVYNTNARLNAHKANDYWESGIIEPDVLLADVVSILHPERLPKHHLKYYRWLP